MRVVAFILAGLLGGFTHSPGPRITTNTYGLDDWRLTVARDSFTSETRCRLENRRGFHPDMVLVAGGLAVSFGRRTDVSEAWYKLDDRPAQPWRDLRAKLLATGSLVELERLDNPSGGWIILPQALLKGVRTINIRPSPKDRPRVFPLDQEPALSAAAQRMGCRFADDPGGWTTSRRSSRASFKAA